MKFVAGIPKMFPKVHLLYGWRFICIYFHTFSLHLFAHPLLYISCHYSSISYALGLCHNFIDKKYDYNSFRECTDRMNCAVAILNVFLRQTAAESVTLFSLNEHHRRGVMFGDCCTSLHMIVMNKSRQLSTMCINLCCTLFVIIIKWPKKKCLALSRRFKELSNQRVIDHVIVTTYRIIIAVTVKYMKGKPRAVGSEISRCADLKVI